MNNSIWKLTALTGVIGLGCLVILWAQQGLSDPEPTDANETIASDTELGSQSPLEELENYVSSAQQEPGQITSDWENGDGNSLSSNSDQEKLDGEKPLTLDEHPAQSNSNNAASNPFGDPNEDSNHVDRANLTKTESEKNKSDSNPLEDKTETAGYNITDSNDKTKTDTKNTTSKSETEGPVILPEMNPGKVQDTKPATKDDGPIFSPDANAFQDKTEKKKDTQGQKSNTPTKQENPFANDEKPVLLDREPVKTKTDSKKEKPSPDYFPRFESKDPKKAEPGNPFDIQSQINNPKQKNLDIPSPHNRQPKQDKSKANPFATDDQTKTDDKKTIPIVPQKRKALKDSPTVNKSDAPPAFVDEIKNPSTDSKTEKAEPPKPEVIAEKSQKPQLAIEKIAPRQAILGQPMVYRILVKNIGRSPAYDVVVEDDVPENVNLKGTIPQARLKNRTLYWKIGTLNPGDSKKILVKVIPRKEGQISSSAKVNFTSVIASKTRVDAPRLKFNLLGPEKAELGDKIVYRFKVENVGTVPVKDVWVRGLLPDQLSHPAGNDVESQIGTLSPGASREIALQVVAKKSGTGIHRAILTASGDFRLESQSAIVVEGEKIELTRYGPQSRPVGKQAVFTNIVTNKSQKTITGVVVTEKVPKGMQFLEATEGGQYNPARRTVNWPLEKLKPQESKSFKIKLNPRIRGNHLTVVKAADKSGMLSTASSTFEVSGYALLRVEIPATKGPLEVGDTVSMTVTVRNLGTTDASNMRLQFAIPPELKLVDLQGPQKYHQIGRTIEVNPVAKILAGKSVSFEVRLRAAKSGDSRLGVQIRSDEMQKPLNREEAIVVLPQ